jgi:hypothetical protein
VNCRVCDQSLIGSLGTLTYRNPRIYSSLTGKSYHERAGFLPLRDLDALPSSNTHFTKSNALTVMQEQLGHARYFREISAPRHELCCQFSQPFDLHPNLSCTHGMTIRLGNAFRIHASWIDPLDEGQFENSPTAAGTSSDESKCNQPHWAKRCRSQRAKAALCDH